MRIDIDLLDDRIVSGPGVRDPVSLFTFKRDTDGELEVRFWSGGVQVELSTAGGAAVGKFGIKPVGEYDGELLVQSAVNWVKTGAGETSVYTFTPSFNGVALTSLLGSSDGSVSNDKASIMAMLEIKWVAAGKKHRTPTVATQIFNDVLKDLDGLPSAFAQLWAPALALTAPPVNGVVGVMASATVMITSTSGLAGATLTIAGRVYTFVAVSTSTASEIVIGATGSTIDNLIQALNAPSFGTANADVSASAFGGGTLVLQARVAGTASNGLTVSSSSIRVTCANLAGGVDAATGTVATALGQLAIVTTTNGSGTFLDVWTSAAIAPVPLWTPPGNIKKDRANGLLYREFYSGGMPATELAYP